MSENINVLSSYNTTTWENGNTITASGLNNIEDGLFSVTEATRNVQQRLNNLSIPDITNLLTDVGQIRGAMNSTSSTISSLNDQVDYLITEVGGYGQGNTSRIDRLDNNIDNLDSRIDDLNDNKQTKITANGILKSNGQGSIQPATPSVDYLTPSDISDLPNAAEFQTLKNNVNGLPSAEEFQTLKNNVSALQTNVNGNVTSLTSLSDNITHLDQDISAIQAISGLLKGDGNGNFSAAAPGTDYLTSSDIPTKVSDLTDGTTTIGRIANLETEVETARGEKADLDARLDAIDTAINTKANSSSLATVATSGSYNDLLNKPTIPDISGKANIVDVQAIATELGMGTLGSLSNTNTIIDALDVRLDAIDGGSAIATTNGTLAARVTALESNPTSATEVIDNTEITYEDGIPTNIGQTPSTDKDYLLQGTDGKYYYWKYIDESWELINGGGSNGGGNSSAIIATALPSIEDADLNTDYFIGTVSGEYVHYRYTIINNVKTPIIISNYTDHDKVKKYNIDTIQKTGSDQTFLRLYEYDYNELSNDINDDLNVDDWSSSTPYEVNAKVLQNGYVYTCITANTDEEWNDSHWEKFSNIKIITTLPLPEGGGGEVSSTYRIYAKNLQDQILRLSLTDANEGITLRYAYTCYAIDGADIDYKAAAYELRTSDGTLISSSNGHTVDQLSKSVYEAGENANIVIPNIQNYCTTNQQTIFILSLYIPDDSSIRPRSVNTYITVVNLSLTSSFSDQKTYSNTNNLVIPYTFTGMNTEPTFRVLLDNNEIINTITNNNITIRSEQLSNISGVHNLSITASQNVSGSILYSNTLNYQIGLLSNSGNNIMLFSGASLEEQKVEQYHMLKLPYYLYIPETLGVETQTVSYLVERVTYDEQGHITSHVAVADLARPSENLSTGPQVFDFRLNDIVANKEYYQVTISCNNQNLVFNITVTRAENQINIRTDNLLFDFKPERYNNNTTTIEERLWSYEGVNATYKMRIPDGTYFDWRTGGWMVIDDVPCFCVKAGSRVEFVQQANNSNEDTPLTLFWPNMETTGSNFKCTFKIDNVKTPNTPFLTSLDTTVNSVINYGKTILASKQDVEDNKTLLHKYLNTKYIHTETFNGTKSIKKAIGVTVPNTAPFADQVNETLRAKAESDAAKKNIKKIKQYIMNIYNIANQASNSEHREYLLKLLSNKGPSDTIDYTLDNDGVTQIANDIIEYLTTLANAESVYNQLINESDDDTTITYAYRQAEPINLDALLNGFVVEGKEGKDGIIAMLQFSFVSTIVTTNDFSQSTVNNNNEASSSTISTNSFEKTGTFRFAVTNTQNNTTKYYEVEMLDELQNGTYTEIKSIRDASNVEDHRYGLELNALGSNIYLPSGVISYAHSEGDIIEFEYNVNPEITGRINSSVIIYEDGVPSAAKLYSTRSNIFEQNSPGCLTIGSDDCDVYIYKMHLYNSALSNQDILGNFYADGLTADEMIARYERNKNLIAAEEITPQLIADNCPDIRVIMIEAPNLTGGKTSFIKNTKIRCIYKNGRPEDNWVALNAYHAGQGTSSDNYGAAGRNLDIMFGFDGEDTVIVPKPQKNNYTFDPNYISTLITGLDDDDTNDIKTAEEYLAAGKTVQSDGKGLISLTNTSVPNNWFNIKVNIASSENTNNAFLQKRFDRYLPYETPARKRGDVKNPAVDIKNSMEFFNCAIFIKETGTPTEFVEDASIAAAQRPWHFYGIGNIGDSKKTDSTRVNIEGDPYEFCVEITDNDLDLSGFCTGVFYISEESKIRSQTARTAPSGNADIPEIHNATRAYICSSNEYHLENSTYTFNISSNELNNTTLYLIPIADTNNYERYMYLNNIWTKVGEPITFTRTSYGIKYPVSKAEWECNLNTYHTLLYNFGGKGWDKSFEFRYDITTKDGETIARNDLEAAMNDLHQKTNKKAFADMYSWIVTSSNTEFNTKLKEQFIEKSPLYWYLFTERYTMIDSRAKNTFYHYGKVYISDDEYNGTVKNTLNSMTAQEYLNAHNEITAKGNITALQIAAEELTFEKAIAQFVYDNRDTFLRDDAQNNYYPSQINNGYRFELWDYDNDTALGINNNGQMVFSAGLEDIDKDPNTGWIYNEAESVIWRRIRENMYNELSALYIKLTGGTCFNAQNLIDEFDAIQAQFPEELWRMDFQRKYYRPFINAGETIYLNDMANGRKKYQRRQFERNMAIYINSKYQRNGSYEPNDLISLRPQFEWHEGVDTTITVKPYSTMYINFAIGNTDNTEETSALSVRVQRGEPYVIETSNYTSGFTNKQFIIYNASRLMSIEGLGNFHSQQFSLGAAKKLTTLILGNSDPSEANTSMDSIDELGLSNGLPLLETLDLQNIRFTGANVPEVFDLTNFPLLKNLNATGCNIRSFTFKDGGMLKNIVFQNALTKIDFRNLYNLNDTYDTDNQLVKAVTLTGAANLTSYNSVNSYSSSYEIVQNMLANAGINNITRLTLNDINWTLDNINDLDPLVELKQKLGNNMNLEGTITLTDLWSNIECNYYNTFWPNIIWNKQSAETQKHPVTYRLSETETKVVYVRHNTSAPDIYFDGIITDMPVKARTPQYEYIFGLRDNRSGKYIEYSGWKLVNGNSYLVAGPIVTNDNLQLEPYFDEREREYTIRWYLDEQKTQLIGESEGTVKYGASYDKPIPKIQNIHSNISPYNNYETCSITITSNNMVEYSIFNGWDKLPANIDPDGDTDYYDICGKWIKTTEPVSISSLFTNTDNLTPEQLWVLANLTEQQKSNLGLSTIKNSPIRYKLGADYDPPIDYPIQPIIIHSDELSPIYNSNFSTNIQPLLEGNDAFTLAIDFCLNSTAVQKTYAIIASCYHSENNVKNGLGLFYNSTNQCIEVGFGAMYQQSSQRKAISNNITATMRNIVILRHPKNDPNLYIYSSLNDASNCLPETPYETTITRINGSTFNSNAYLNFGQLIDQSRETIQSNDGIMSNVEQANSTIYWAKYWNEDLGYNKCLELANWPHEQMNFKVSYLLHDNDAVTIPKRVTGNDYNPYLYLATLNLPMHGKITHDRIQYGSFVDNLYSWENSILRTLSNNRIYNSLPIALQSILAKSNINSQPIVFTPSSGFDGASYSTQTSAITTQDYVYLYSMANVQEDAAPYEVEDSKNNPFDWLVSKNITLYNRNTNGGWSSGTNSTTDMYFNLRFPGKAINTKELRVYIDKVSNSNLSPIAASIGSSSLRSGDIYLEQIIANNYSAYIYVSNEEINTYGFTVVSDSKFIGLSDKEVVNIESNSEGLGGWIQAEEYWTRSITPGQNSTQGVNFIYIDQTDGKPTISNASNSSGRKISYMLAI